MDSKRSRCIEATKEMVKERHKLVYDITTRLESFSLNTVISGFHGTYKQAYGDCKEGGRY